MNNDKDKDNTTKNEYKPENDIEKILITEEELAATVLRLAAEIDRDMAATRRRLLLVCILKGSLIFCADIMRKLKTPFELEFMRASSYSGGTISSGELKISLDVEKKELSNVDVLLIEDIIDSGNTLSKIAEHFRQRGAASVRSCALLDKPERREVDYKVDYVGIRVPNEFVVGYGLDVDELYRGLPYVGVLKPEIIKKYIK